MVDTEGTWWTRLRTGFRHAFAVAAAGSLTAEQMRLLDRVADLVVSRRLGLVAELLLETSRPLNFLASQAMVFLDPYLQPFFSPADYRALRAALEQRASIDYLLQAIEEKQQDPNPKQAV